MPTGPRKKKKLGRPLGMPPARALEKEEAERKKQEEADKANIRMRRTVAKILKTQEGRDVFTYLYHVCQYPKTAIALSPFMGEAAIYSAARRSVYERLREFASPEALIPIELPPVEEK